MSYSTGNRGGGRRSYGERSAVASRPPIDHKAVWQKRADDLGVSLGTWLIIAANEKADLPLPDFVIEELEKATAAKELSMLEGLRMPRAS